MNQPVAHHIAELRRRLMWSAMILGVGAGVGYLYRNAVLDWLQAPLHGSLYYSKITGAFEFLMQACLMVGVLVAIPVVVYNLICFVRPALPRPVRRRQILGVVVASCSLTIAGVAFAYYVSLPTLLHFLSTIDVSHLHPLIAADSYLTFVVNYLATFAIVFQLPLVISFIDGCTPLPPKKLKKFRKWVMLGAFGAALILPIAPDPISQIMLALPVIVLYEISIWLVVIAHHRRPAAAPESEPVPETPQPQRLPMAIAVPNPPIDPPARQPKRRNTAYHPRVMDPRRPIGPRTLDLRKH